MHVTRFLAEPTPPPPTADERRDADADVGRFDADDGCTPTDWRRVTGRPTESVLPSRPMREVERSSVGVAPTREVVGRAPVRCDGIAWFFLVSADGVAGDLVSVRAFNLDDGLSCRGVPVCGDVY